MKKYVFAIGGAVVGTVLGLEGNGISYSGPAGSVKYVVDPEIDVELGWIVTGTAEAPIFTAP